MDLSPHIIGIINWAEQTLFWRRDDISWSDQRVALFELYAPWSKSVALRQFRLFKMPGSDPDDFIQYASMGLLEAIDRFQPKFGIPFKSFAYTRVRGAIINNVFRFTEKSHIFAWQRSRRAVRMQAISEVNMREHSGSAAEALINSILDAALGIIIEQKVEEPENLLKGELYQSHEIAMMQNSFVEQIETLPEKQKLVMQKHYMEMLSFTDIAMELGVTVGRVSQLHKLAMKKLKSSILYI